VCVVRLEHRDSGKTLKQTVDNSKPNRPKSSRKSRPLFWRLPVPALVMRDSTKQWIVDTSGPKIETNDGISFLI